MRSLLVGAVAVMTLAAGCSGSDDASSSGEPETATNSEDTVDESEAPTEAEEPAAEPEPPTESVAFQFTVKGVVGGQNVPIENTCDGANETPPVTIEGVPPDVEELVLIVEDPDAPTESPFVHWLVYGIGPDTTVVTDGDATLTYGLTDAGTESWFGPCPPAGEFHTYRWRLLGLSTASGLEPGLDGRIVEDAITGSVVVDALVISSYSRAE